MSTDMALAADIIEKFQYIDDRIDIDEANLTPIQEFYKNAKVFLTGGTGFLGQVLIEKLLRSTPVSTIYVLIRNKKGKDTQTRLNQMFDDPLYKRLEKTCPYFRQKVIALEGDCLLKDLGISVHDKKMLIDEVNIVIHGAATVRFDEKLKRAVTLNVRATRDLTLLVQQITHLKAFVHVSTAYSNCIHKVIEEKLYPTPIDYSHVIGMAENLDELTINSMTSHFIDKYPNTYVFTKQIAEDVVRQKTQGLPTGIYRPAIVISTYKEPVRGWINNLYGPTGIFYGAAVGLLRVLYCNKNNEANMVPVDMCVNGLIASAWDTANKFKKAKDKKEQFEIPIYTFESTNDKTISWTRFRNLSARYTPLFPSYHCLWVYFMYLIKSYTMVLVLEIFLHFIPGMIADAILFCRGKKMRIVAAYKKIHNFQELVMYFSVTRFIFKNANVQKMLSEMSQKDREVFFCDLKQLDWDEFFRYYGLGARVYLAKDPISTLPEGAKFYKKLVWAHRISMTVLVLLGLTILWLITPTSYKQMFVD